MKTVLRFIGINILAVLSIPVLIVCFLLKVLAAIIGNLKYLPYLITGLIVVGVALAMIVGIIQSFSIWLVFGLLFFGSIIIGFFSIVLVILQAATTFSSKLFEGIAYVLENASEFLIRNIYNKMMNGMANNAGGLVKGDLYAK